MKLGKWTQPPAGIMTCLSIVWHWIHRANVIQAPATVLNMSLIRKHAKVIKPVKKEPSSYLASDILFALWCNKTDCLRLINANWKVNLDLFACFLFSSTTLFWFHNYLHSSTDDDWFGWMNVGSENTDNLESESGRGVQAGFSARSSLGWACSLVAFPV